ncbi:MAG: hypothetical protein ACE5IJ_11615 [Thermoplasmata archaeon]
MGKRDVFALDVIALVSLRAHFSGGEHEHAASRVVVLLIWEAPRQKMSSSNEKCDLSALHPWPIQLTPYPILWICHQHSIHISRARITTGTFPEGENMKMKNSFGTKFSGTMDKMTAVTRNGVNFLRTHVVPHNPRSPLQQRNRNHFAGGVETWRSLREVQRRFYNGIAKRTSGYNVFLGKWMGFHTKGEEPEVPLILAGTPLKGDEGWFILRRGTKPLFECPLTDVFEIALTVEDGPYDLVLRLGGVEDVITIENISALELPATLEGLGLRVQLDLSKEASR